ncbi:OmpA family protein [Hoeflea sp. AS16]|uniref:OmpA family protein n=1 Tax=Hoeflea sp. AS16 TaxID=3135779 RepID=UPI00316C6D51
MTLTRILLASTAISLAGLGSSGAAPFSQTRSLDAARPAVTQYLSLVQLSIGDAEAQLAEALARKAEAEASGGDLAAAQAEVEAAQAGLAAAQAAVEATAEPTVEAVETPAAPVQVPEATEAPAASEEAPAETVQPAPEPAGKPEAATEPAPEQPVTETAPVEDIPEPAAEVEAAPEMPAAVAEEAAPVPEPAPEAENTTEPEIVDEPVPPSTVTPEPKPAIQSEETPAATETTPAETVPGDAPAPVEPADAAEQPAAEVIPETKPAAADADTKAPVTPKEEVLTLPIQDGAPVLDSAKEEPVAGDGDASRAAAPASSEPAPPPPTSDADAQASTAKSEPAPKALSERGERTSERPEREAQTNVSIINQIDNRTIIEVDNRTIVEHDDRDRLQAGSNEVYYERLGGGRVREVIVRPNGVQLVTVTNRWGDVIQRSRVMPDGREYVLFYANANSDGSREAFVDPGRRLPPLRLSIPISDYILDSTDANPSAFLEFLMEPPVERVERLYSVEEVRRSARIRDKVRRIDLDSLTFEFGKATIAEDQIQRLSDVADAVTSILERNPAETFLIEGHTDAVGRDEANLLLSDRRAETIAVALSDVFGIPPENLVTQGYGERYLKVRTEAPERLNRRVTIRRITPLVAPVASR